MARITPDYLHETEALSRGALRVVGVDLEPVLAVPQGVIRPAALLIVQPDLRKGPRDLQRHLLQKLLIALIERQPRADTHDQ